MSEDKNSAKKEIVKKFLDKFTGFGRSEPPDPHIFNLREPEKIITEPEEIIPPAAVDDIPIGTDVRKEGKIQILRIYEKGYICPNLVDDIVPIYTGSRDMRNYGLNRLDEQTHLFLAVVDNAGVSASFRILKGDNLTGNVPRKGDDLANTMAIFSFLKGAYFAASDVTIYGMVTRFKFASWTGSSAEELKFVSLKAVELKG